MKSSEALLKEQSAKIPKWAGRLASGLGEPRLERAGWVFALISFAGLLDASYLAAKHYTATPINCSLFQGCEKVITSPYAVVFGIPVALFGAIYYFAVLILALAYLDAKKSVFIYFISWFSSLGLLASLWFLYLQIFVIKALCLYCLGSAASSILIFILGMWILKFNNKNQKIR